MSTSNVLREYETLLGAIVAKEEKLALAASAHFANMRSQIKTQQGYFKKSCDVIAKKLIDRVDDFEKIWLEKLASTVALEPKVGYECVDELQKMKHILEEKFRSINSIEFDIEKYTFETKSINLSTNSLGSLNFDTYIPLVVSSFDSTIKTFNLNSGKCLRTLKGHESYISGIKKVSNNEIATSSWDNTIRIWNIRVGECVRILEGHKSWVACLKFHNGMLITGSGDNSIKVWDVATGELTMTLLGHDDYLTCLKIISYGRLLSGSGNFCLNLFSNKVNYLGALKSLVTC